MRKISKFDSIVSSSKRKGLGFRKHFLPVTVLPIFFFFFLFFLTPTVFPSTDKNDAEALCRTRSGGSLGERLRGEGEVGDIRGCARPCTGKFKSTSNVQQFHCNEKNRRHGSAERQIRRRLNIKWDMTGGLFLFQFRAFSIFLSPSHLPRSFSTLCTSALSFDLSHLSPFFVSPCQKSSKNRTGVLFPENFELFLSFSSFFFFDDRVISPLHAREHVYIISFSTCESLPFIGSAITNTLLDCKQ